MTRTKTDLTSLVRLDRQLRALGVRAPGAKHSPVACRAIRVATVPTGERGCLVLANGQLVAVLVRVGPVRVGGVGEDAAEGMDGDAEPDGWHLETGYGACNMAVPPLFGTLNEALAWVARRLPDAA